MANCVKSLYQAILIALVVNVAGCGSDSQNSVDPTKVTQCDSITGKCSVAGSTSVSTSVGTTGGQKPDSSTATSVVSTTGGSSNATTTVAGTSNITTTGGSSNVSDTTATTVPTSTTGGDSSTGGSAPSTSNVTGGNTSVSGTGGTSAVATTTTTTTVVQTTGGSSSTGTTSTIVPTTGGKSPTGGSTATGGTSFSATSTCQSFHNGLCVGPDTGGTAPTGGSSATGGSDATGGTSSVATTAVPTTGGSDSTGGSSATTGGSSATTGGQATTGGNPSLVCGTVPTVPAKSYNGTLTIVRDEAFEAMNTALGNPMAIMHDTWCSSAYNDCYAVTADMGSNRWLAHGNGSTWSVVDSLPVPADALTNLAPSSVTGSSSTQVVVGASVMDSSYGNNSTMFYFKNGTSWTPERLPLALTSGMEGQPVSMWTDGRYLFAVLVNNESTQWLYDYEIVIRDMTTGNWSKPALPAHELPFQLNHIWGLTACNVFAVGSENGHAVMIHFDGVAWSRVTTIPSDVVGLNSVHGSTDEIVVVGKVADSPSTGHAVFLSSSGAMLLKSWNRKDGPSDISGGGDAVWSPGNGIAIFGANTNPASSFAASLTVLVGNTWSGQQTVGEDAGYVHAIWGDGSSGRAVLGIDGKTSTGSKASIYRVCIQ
ncbi:MAG: hypothetical protein WC477_01155 [Patescibacteria group bacterium]